MAQRFAASPSILSFMAESPTYGQLSSTSAMERAKNEAANLIGNARMHGAGITGSANREIAKYRGKAGLAQDRADGYAAMMGGLADGVSSIVGGVARRPSGGGGGVTTYDHSNPVDIGGTSYPMMDIDDYNFDARWDN